MATEKVMVMSKNEPKVGAKTERKAYWTGRRWKSKIGKAIRSDEANQGEKKETSTNYSDGVSTVTSIWAYNFLVKSTFKSLGLIWILKVSKTGLTLFLKPDLSHQKIFRYSSKLYCIDLLIILDTNLWVIKWWED